MRHILPGHLATHLLADFAGIHGSFVFDAKQVDALVVYAAIVWMIKCYPVGLQAANGAISLPDTTAAMHRGLSCSPSSSLPVACLPAVSLELEHAAQFQ